LLAMVAKDNACLLTKRSARESIASKLAPTVISTTPVAGFFVPGFQAKKSQRSGWLGLSG